MSKLKIALLSSWGIRCGLASYSEDLARAWMYRGHEIQLFCERSLDGMTEDPADLPPPERYFLRTMHQAEELVAPILEWGPDLVSIEHEFGVGPNDAEFIKAISLLRLYTKTIVTLHTVPRWPFRRWFFSKLEGPVVVHHPGALVALRSWVRSDWCKPYYLPHGIAPYAPLPVRCSDRSPLALMPGFISASKGHIDVIDGINHSDGWEIEIIGDAPNGEYLDYILDRITYLGVSQRVKVVPQFLERRALREKMASAQVVILNTTSDNYSASGQAADCISVGAMTVSRALPIYDALYGLGFKFGVGRDGPPADELGRTVMTAAASVHNKEQVEAMKAMCAARSWDRMAKERLRIVGLA